jgi:hypothetical protein
MLLIPFAFFEKVNDFGIFGEVSLVILCIEAEGSVQLKNDLSIGIFMYKHGSYKIFR